MSNKYLTGFLGLSVLLIGGAWYGFNDAAPPTPTVTEPRVAQPAQQMAPWTQAARVATVSGGDNPIVRFNNGQLSLNAHNLSLLALLEEIANASGISIVNTLTNSAPKISVQWTDVPLESALRQLLPGYDVLFLYGHEGSASVLQAAWVLPAGAGKQAITNAHATATQPQTPRAHGVGTPEGDWLQALRDPQPKVREHTFTEALVSATPLPLPLLQDMARHDASAPVRVAALQALTRSAADNYEVVRVAAQIATADPDPSVRSTAHELLDHVAAITRGANEVPESTISIDPQQLGVPMNSEP